MATRALAARADDADDATLLALIGPAAVPASGDVAALFAPGADRLAGLVGVVSAEPDLGRRLGAYADRHPAALAGYAELIAGRKPRIIHGASPAATIGPHAPTSQAEPGDPVTAAPGAGDELSLGQAIGLVAELVAPLNSGAEPDALLILGSTDPDRRYDTADLATVEVLAALLSARRTIRELARRESALREQIDANAQAGRQLAHRLNNDLTMPVGVVELLLDRGTAGPDLQEMLEAASNDLAAIERHVNAFHDEMRGRTTGPASGSAGPRPRAADPGYPRSS